MSSADSREILHEGDARDHIDNAIEIAERNVAEGLAANLAQNEIAGRLDKLGNLLSTRFQRFGKVADIEKAIRRAEEALDITSQGQLSRVVRLSTTATYYYYRYQRLEALESLEKAVEVTKQALQALGAIQTDPNQRSQNDDLGNILIGNLSSYLGYRYNCMGTVEDLQKAIELKNQLLEKTPADHPGRAAWLNNLGGYLRHRYQRLEALEDLEKAIDCSEQALEATIKDDPNRAIFLNNLGRNLGDRYERLGILEDLESAITQTQQALDAAAADTPGRADWLNNLASLLCDRYQRLGNLEDLEEAIHLCEQALEATPEDHPSRDIWISNLAGYLSDRFERRGILKDLEKAIELGEQVLDTKPANHPGLSNYLGNLSSYLAKRYDRLEALEDLDKAIELSKKALEAIPIDHPERAQMPSEQALEATPEDQIERANILNALNCYLITRYKRLGVEEDLEKAIQQGEHLLLVKPEDNPSRVIWISNLAEHLRIRYGRLGALEDLDEALDLIQQALEATPVDHPDRAERLQIMSNIFSDRFGRLGTLEDLDEALDLIQQALEATPVDHPDRAERLQIMSNIFSDRFGRLGTLEDLEKAIELNKQVLEATPEDHSDKARRLGNLGNSYSDRYLWLGSPEDLEKAIELSEAALEVTTINERDRIRIVGNLSNSLSERYSRLGAFKDIQKTIRLAEEVLEATPADHPNNAKSLGDLGTHFYTRAKRMESLEDLGKAIELSEQALEATPEGHPDRAARLSILSNYMSERYLQLGDSEDFDTATALSVLALMETPKDHPDRANWMNTLGSQFIDKYERLQDAEDLERAIDWYEKALKALPPGHIQHGLLLDNLGTWIAVRPSPTFRDLYYILGINLEAWNILVSPPSLRINAARRAARIYSTLNNWKESSSILEDAIKLLPEICPRQLQLDDQQHRLLDLADLASEAASAALQAGLEASHCLRLLELSRGIIMGLIIDSRSSLSELQKQHPEIYKRLDILRTRIDAPIELVKHNGVEPLLQSNEYSDQGRRRQRENDIAELEQLFTSIRNLPGFGGFLLPPPAEDLIAIASEGPIIILNSTEIRSDAIIVTKSSIRQLPLPNLLFSDAKMWMEQLSKKLIRGKNSTYPSRNGKLKTLLLWLWDVAVGPILEELQLQPTANDSDLSRVWWIGVGLLSMAPFHAAGDHSPGSTQNTLCRVISSYIPTIKALSYAREKKLELLSQHSRLLLVTMPETPKHNSLSSAPDEVKMIARVVKSVSEMGLLESPDAAEVLEKLKGCSAVHFACHGVSNGKDPSNSHLLLCKNRDLQPSLRTVDKLTVGAISREKSTHAQLAYLSACSTARNDSEDLADESLHIASAFQLAGFSHVLATLWISNDQACLQVSSEFYRLLYDGQPTDGCHSRVSTVFHNAVRKLRNEYWRQPLIWASFIHTGA